MKRDIQEQASCYLLAPGFSKYAAVSRQVSKVQEARSKLQGAVDRDEAASTLVSVQIGFSIYKGLWVYNPKSPSAKTWKPNPRLKAQKLGLIIRVKGLGFSSGSRVQG